jgi:hypothetical protein
MTADHVNDRYPGTARGGEERLQPRDHRLDAAQRHPEPPHVAVIVKEVVLNVDR